MTQTTGRRKEAVARVRLRPGTGKVVINGREFEDYFPNALQRAAATEAFRVVEAETTYDVDCDIQGGGIAGQAGALRMAIARSILELDEEKRSVLRKAGLLTRDSRKKESKKYGLKKARKAPQYTKR
ncbi:MAG: 30S ribosomal protein S9 [Ilumatobacteraceae bacterium]